MFKSLTNNYYPSYSSIIWVALFFTPICSLFYKNRNKSCILDTQQFVLRILGPFVTWQTSVNLCSLNEPVTEMRTSSLLLAIIVFITLCTSNVQSKHRRRSDKKPKPTHHHPKPSKPKPKPKPCQSLTHCVTDQWSLWSNCSVACGTNGTQTRTRKVSYVRGFLWLIVRNLNCMKIGIHY